MAFNAFNQDEKTEKRSSKMDILRVFSYLLKYKGRIFAVLLLIAFGTFVSLLNPVLIEKAIDTYIAAKDMGGLVKIALLAIGLNLLMIGAIKLRMIIMARTSNRVIEEIRDDLYCHVQSLDLPFFDSFPNNLFSILFLIVPILLFIFAYHKTPSFYVKETPSGLIITGAKQGLYDPDFIEFDKISGVEMNKNSLVISVTSQQQTVELYVPKKYRAELFDALKKRAGV